MINRQSPVKPWLWHWPLCWSPDLRIKLPAYWTSPLEVQSLNLYVINIWKQIIPFQGDILYITGLLAAPNHQIDATNPKPPVGTNKNVYRHWQMMPGSENDQFNAQRYCWNFLTINLSSLTTHSLFLLISLIQEMAENQPSVSTPNGYLCLILLSLSSLVWKQSWNSSSSSLICLKLLLFFSLSISIYWPITLLIKGLQNNLPAFVLLFL